MARSGSGSGLVPVYGDGVFSSEGGDEMGVLDDRSEDRLGGRRNEEMRDMMLKKAARAGAIEARIWMMDWRRRKVRSRPAL